MVCVISVKCRTGKRYDASRTNGYILGTGKVTPDKVAPNEPTIDTMLIMSATAGKREKMKSANACVAMTKRTVIAFINSQLP